MAHSTTNDCKAKGFDAKLVRAWAKRQGLEVKDRGRIPAEVITAFEVAAWEHRIAGYNERSV